ncbi:O-antigen ligase family protein [Sporolactobacillus sp. CPB3-1]|uniref:O-antigen ligase family protein n=1 Tax=Sporolactobacillus mangiferae TaxID=2940498 RepID=A0ABT0M8I2_9BACL|nr:PssD/Cps14F family polysaccharide biosynthesis glycosyltransferase [Sporolactobacillus mangiferae]MCL1631171.1 O-antigen ligase family protein [Sporolactobacillus mangiferae]
MISDWVKSLKKVYFMKSRIASNWYEFIFFLSFVLVPIIDSLNGYLLFTFGQSVLGQLFRTVVILIFSTLIIKYSSAPKLLKLCLLIIPLLLLQIGYFLIYHSIHGLVFDLTNIFKIIFIIVSIETFRVLKKEELVSKGTIENILNFCLILFPLTILIPKILGVGYSAYSNGGGYSAFYYANNDINIVLIVLLIYSLDLLFNSVSLHQFKFRYLFLLILMVVVTLLIGSKSSIAFFVISILIYLLRSFRINSIKSSINFLVGILISVSIFLMLVLTVFAQTVGKIIERNLYFFRISNNIIDYIFSDRNLFLDSALHFIYSDHILPKVIFGIGFYQKNVNTGIAVSHFFGSAPRQIEMDIFDTFFAYGLIGFILIYGYIFLIYIRHLVYSKKKKELFGYNLSFIVIIAFSTLAGHVLYSALSGSFLALICSMLLIENDEKDSKTDICLISSSGGHLEQLKRLLPIVKEYSHTIITEKNTSTSNMNNFYEVNYLIQQDRKKTLFILVYLINFLISAVFYLRFRPKIIISTGAGVVIPFCLIGKLFGSKIIFIESFAKVNSPTITGRIVYKFADQFYIQWTDLKKCYPKGIYRGTIY